MSREKLVFGKLREISKANTEFFGFCINNKDIIPAELTHDFTSRLLNIQYVMSEAMLAYIENFIDEVEEFKNAQDVIDSLKAQYKKQMENCHIGYESVKEINAHIN